MRARTLITFILSIVLLASSATPALGLTRLEIIARAQRWVDLEVSYSQVSWFETYRQDCSGMASMAWRLKPPGYSSRTLAPYGVPISRDELQPGDMMLKYDYHAAIFYKWANAEHTWYWALEQSSSVGNAVCRLTAFPYWGHDGFTAYRPINFEEIDDYEPYILPVAGDNRYSTAVEASTLAFESGSTTNAVICSGENWPDALGGSALAGSLEGPILLVGQNRLPWVVTEELARLGVENVTVIGGPSAVTTEVVTAIGSLPGVDSVDRIGGRNRYETAAMVASETVRVRAAASLPYDGGVYVATGSSFPDALGAATVAAHTGRPIVLSKRSTLPTVTAETIGDIGADHAYIAGGPAALDFAIESALTTAGVNGLTRFAGSDRYDTSYQLAEHAVAEGLVWDDVALATGQGFADALAGAVMQARRGSVLVLTPGKGLDPSADKAVREHMELIEKVTILGGESAISRTARRQIRWIIDEP